MMMMHDASLKFQGGGSERRMLPYKTAQQTLKTAVQDLVFKQCGMHIYLKFESYNLQSKKPRS